MITVQDISTLYVWHHGGVYATLNATKQHPNRAYWVFCQMVLEGISLQCMPFQNTNLQVQGHSNRREDFPILHDEPPNMMAICRHFRTGFPARSRRTVAYAASSGLSDIPRSGWNMLLLLWAFQIIYYSSVCIIHVRAEMVRPMHFDPVLLFGSVCQIIIGDHKQRWHSEERRWNLLWGEIQ